jgi:anion-transporting  ArsA/GET3 family ATPase
MTRQALEFRDQRLVVCLGPGGVGKTTFSAALALDAARGGRTVDVMTIDPAPRLIDALGLDEEATMPRPVDLSCFAGNSSGRLRAMRLDPKRTFDDLVKRYAPSAAARDAIMAGRIYQNLSNALAGVADYMAMERLLDLYRENDASLIVLDTPPAQDALDFLDAPRRMLELIGSRAIRLLSASRGLLRAPSVIVDMAARAILAAFDRITGLHLLADVRAFVTNFEGMYEGFAARATAAQALLSDPRTTVMLVTTTEQGRIAQACRFAETLRQMGIPLGSIVVNRMMRPPPDPHAIDDAKIPASLKRKLKRNLADFTALKERDADALATLRGALGQDIAILGAPDYGREPRSLKDLAKLAENLRSL